jgi:hypothetical protein
VSGGKSAAWRVAAVVFGLAVLWLWTPPDIPVCGFRALTGRLCPLCGLTHAMFALAKGHFAEAIHWHALSPLVALLLVGAWWNGPRMARVWTPSLLVFAGYGLLRIVAG